MKSIFYLTLERRDAIAYTNYISNIILFFISLIFSILIYYSKNISLLFVLSYLWYIVFKENKIYRMKIRAYNMLKDL